MRKTFIGRRLGASAATCLVAFSAGCSARHVDEDGASASVESALDQEGFHEVRAGDFEIPVDASTDGRLLFHRVGVLRYEIVLVENGAKSVVASARDSKRINPLAMAHHYEGVGTLVCVNTFATTKGDRPMLDCELFDDHAVPQNRGVTVADAWLRSMSDAEPLARVSMQTAFAFSDDGKTCRAVRVEKGLVFDEKTPVHCSDDFGDGMVVLEPGGGSGGVSGGGGGGGRDVNGGGGIDGDGFDRVKHPIAPMQTRLVAKCREDESEPVTAEWDKSWSGGKTVTDFPSEGLTTGFSVWAKTKGAITTHPQACLDKDAYASGTIGGQLVVGRYALNLQGSAGTSERSCSTQRCNEDGSFSCGAPSGSSKSKDYSIGGGGQYSVPLDFLPPLRPFCGSRIVSCNIDIGVNGNYSKGEGDASGGSSCGSGCIDADGNHTGEATSWKSEGVELGLTVAGEIEVSLGRLGNGRVGISGEGSWSLSVRDQKGCGGIQDSEVRECIRFGQVKWYRRACIGNGWLSYCWDKEGVVLKGFKSGQCN